MSKDISTMTFIKVKNNDFFFVSKLFIVWLSSINEMLHFYFLLHEKFCHRKFNSMGIVLVFLTPIELATHHPTITVTKFCIR